MKVTIVWSLQARSVEEHELELPANSTLELALQAFSHEVPDSVWQSLRGDQVWSIWGRRVGLDQSLMPGDRLEWTRPLRVDPKVARLERFVSQGMRKAGLFTKKPRAAKG